ncbi:MAG TPA: LamG domain-containing protein [Kofleriaceae bacterium]|nr:LamG domain-containing protein [Kofleriaceae bacterium]
MKRLAVLAILLCGRTASAQVDPMVGLFEIDGDYGSSINQYNVGAGSHSQDALEVRDGGYTTHGALDDANCTNWAHATAYPYMGTSYYSTYCGANVDGEVRRSEQQMLIGLTGGNDHKRYFSFAFRLNAVPANPADSGGYIAQWHQSSDMPPPVRLSWSAQNGKYYLDLIIRRDEERGSTTRCYLASETLGYDEATGTFTHEIAPYVWHRVLVAFDAGPLVTRSDCSNCLGDAGSVSAYLMNNETGAWELVEKTYTGRVGWAYNSFERDSDGDGDVERECIRSRRPDQDFELSVGQYYLSDGPGYITEYDNVAYGKRWADITKHYLVGYQKSVLRYRFEESGSTVADSSYLWNGGPAGDPNNDYNNDGTVVGTRVITPGLSGTNAMHFNGSTHVEAPVDPVDFDFGNYVTVSTWFKTTSHPSNNRGIVAIDQASTSWKALLYGTDSSLSFGVRHPDGTTSRASFSFPAGRYNNGQWHHLVGTFNRFSPDARVKLYIDGQRVAEATGTDLPVLRGDDRLVVGKYLTSNYFTGAIDEVNLFNYPMTADDVYGLYLERGTP